MAAGDDRTARRLGLERCGEGEELARAELEAHREPDEVGAARGAQDGRRVVPAVERSDDGLVPRLAQRRGEVEERQVRLLVRADEQHAHALSSRGHLAAVINVSTSALRDAARGPRAASQDAVTSGEGVCEVYARWGRTICGRGCDPARPDLERALPWRTRRASTSSSIGGTGSSCADRHKPTTGAPLTSCSGDERFFGGRAAVRYAEAMEARTCDPRPDQGERPPRRGTRGRWLLVAAAAVGVVATFDAPRQIAGGAWSGVTGRPPLRVQRTGDLFIVDVQTLGEYQTSVAGVRLSRGGEVVWEIRAAGRVPQIWTFGLRVGENRGVPVCGGGARTSCDGPELLEDYETVRPTTGSFVIDRGTRYLLEVWGNDSSWSRASTTIIP